MSEALTPPAAGTAAGSATGEFFSRRATGLVRLGTPLRVLVLNFANIGLVYIMFTYWAQPAVFPQSHLLAGIAIAAVFNAVFCLGLAIFASSFPRSGGEYVYVSRSIHPAVGFAVSFAAALSQSFWVGVGGYWISTLALAPITSTFGTTTGNETLVDWGAKFATANSGFIFGTAFVIVALLINLGGLRTYFRFQAINFPIGVLTFLVLLGVYLFASPSDFERGLNEYSAGAGGSSNAYDDILAAATEGGMPTGTSLMGLLGIFGIIWLVGIASTYIAGEVRSPKRTQVIGSVGGSLVYSAAVFLLALLMFKPVGEGFNKAATWVSYNTDTYYDIIPSDPTFVTWAAVLVDNWAVLLLVGIGLVIWSYFWIPSAMMIATRAVFAWSFDRLVPAKLSEVNQRTNSPVWAVVAVAVVGEAFLIAYWRGWFDFLAPFLAYGIVFLTVSVAAIVASYRPSTRKFITEAGWDKRYFGVPLLALCGGVGVVYWGLALWFALTEDLLFLNTTKQIVLTGLQFAIPLVIFAAITLWRRSQGVDLALAYKELPPE
ncbi:MAG TPA: amino acid permease [Gaiellaceae bacterium]|nr:amino acid permease [Gaiellaceae bacterium]